MDTPPSLSPAWAILVRNTPRNRHNAGFIVVDELHAHYKFGPWKAKFDGLVVGRQPRAAARPTS
jgi:hypothetical protein